MDIELWERVSSVGLGGAGWILFTLAAAWGTKVQAKYEKCLIEQRDAALAALRLQEQRIFDLKSAQIMHME